MAVRVVRGRGASPAEDAALLRRLLDQSAHSNAPVIRVWRPHRQLAFGRLDTGMDGYRAAAAAAGRAGFPPIRRTVGGRAAATTQRCVALASIEPIDDPRRDVDRRYESVATTVAETLSDRGATIEHGEPPHSFCPGTHSLHGSGKIAGFGQRIRSDVALTAGIVIVDGAREIATVLDSVYRHLELPFDHSSVGSVAEAGGPSDPSTVRRAIEQALVGNRTTIIEPVSDRET